MKLHFAHHGLQFFFLTICVRGRRAVLSRLVEGEKRPELTRAGECVKALWRVIHGVNDALTASDYVIMPDHVHLLLIVNYNKDPAFNPLVFIHWFMEESERMIAKDGGCTPEPPPGGKGTANGIAAKSLPAPPTAMRRSYFGGAGAKSPSVANFWETSFWLDLSFSSRQLKAIRKYIRNNPARALWKRNNADMFICRSHFRHPVLDPSLPWTACGDLTLLGNPFMVAVSLTRRKSLTEHESEIAALVEKARQGWIIVCGFLSPGEKELGRRLKAEPKTRWIKTMAQGLPPRFDPTVEDSRYLSEHRQLMLSALPIGAPFDWNTCHTMNNHAAAMCRRARGEE